MRSSPRTVPRSFARSLERGEKEPEWYGRVEVDGERAGALAFSVANRRSRIANLYGLMIHPDFRGRGLADAAARVFSRHLILDLDFHRLELECYGFNERAIRHAERIYVREASSGRPTGATATGWTASPSR